MAATLRPDGTHAPITLGELIQELQAVEKELGSDVDVVTVDGVGDTRQMWSASPSPSFPGVPGFEAYCEIFLTAESDY